MDLYEYQAKRLFSKFKLPILKNWVISEVSEINNCLISITNNFPFIVKCQIHAGGRGKSGGVQLVYTKEEIIFFVKKWLGKPLITCQTTDFGEIVDSILIESSVNIVQELYLSVLIDRDTYQIIFITSKKGGVNIENLISDNPNLLYKTTINPTFNNAYPYEGRIIARQLGLEGIQIDQFVKIYTNIIRMFIENDLMLVEVNPLVITEDNKLICLDAKIIVDDNALFRQLSLIDLCLKTENNNNNLSTTFNPLTMNYVNLDGNIGCMVNGAGLAMATMDLMKSLGGSPANFLDIGGDTNSDDIVLALKMLLKNKRIQAIFINIFGGIVCCDLVASSIITALSECVTVTNIPIVVRLAGNNAQLGSEKLVNSNFKIIVINNLVNALKKVIKLVK